MKFDAFDPQKASFGTWFYFVLNNKIKNYYRDHKNHEDIDQVIYATELFEDEVVAAVELSRIRNDLKIALDMLPNMQRRIIILKYFKNKDAAEISKITGLSHSNVRVQLMRALNKVKNYFETKGIEWEG